jgi:galactofuranose transport system substrate-binding protein
MPLTHRSGFSSRARRAAAITVAAFAVAVLAACSSSAPTTAGSTTSASAAVAAPDISADLSPMEQAEAYEKAVPKASKDYQIAVFNTCADSNAWCQAMFKYQAESAKQQGVTLTTFAAEFDPAKQLRQVQDAIAKGGWDGYILQPVTAAAGCQMMNLLLATGKPVQGGNSPVCEDESYHEGTTGFVSTSTIPYYESYLKYVFDQFDGKTVNAIVIGGVAGQDGWRRLQSAIKTTVADYPNVTIKVEQPGNYDPNTAFKITQDGLQSNPDVNLILSAYDEMSRGVIKAIDESGRTLGTDLQLFSIGGTPYGIAQVKAGTISATVQSDPYPEGHYTVIELLRFLDTGVATTGFSSTNDWSGIVDGPGSPYLTKENVDKYTPTYGTSAG